MRTKPLGSVCNKKRRRNSSSDKIIKQWCVAVVNSHTRQSLDARSCKNSRMQSPALLIVAVGLEIFRLLLPFPGQPSNGATAREPRFPSKRRRYSVYETGGVPLSMKV